MQCNSRCGSLWVHFSCKKVQRIVDSGWVFEWNWSNAPCTQDNGIIADSFNELARINNSFRLYLIKWFCTCTFCIICRIMAENPNTIKCSFQSFQCNEIILKLKIRFNNDLCRDNNVSKCLFPWPSKSWFYLRLSGK